MTFHPRERGDTTRRQFLVRSGGAAFGLTGAASLLAACGSSSSGGASPGGTTGGGGKGPGGIPLARPDRPVKLPIYADNKTIPSGRRPETGGTFTIYNYVDYIDKQVLKDFGKKYGVQVRYSTFDSIDEAIAKLASGAVDADVTEITTERVASAVAGKLLMPINHSYIPNLKANVLPSFQSPFYDAGSQYTVPYTVYTTGIMWRNDHVTEDIASMSNPWDIFWKSQAYKGKVGVLNDSREAVVLAILRDGSLDVNTEDPKVISQAQAALQQLVDICNVKVDETQYQTIPEGKSWLHQAWSGDAILAANYYLPKGTKPSVLSYWHAPKGKGPIGNDCWSVLKGTKKPVLAHLFLDYLLDNKVGHSNFVNYTGYQPPLKSITPSSLVQEGIVPKNLESAVVREGDYGQGALQELTLTTQGQTLYQNAYSQFQSGAS